MFEHAVHLAIGPRADYAREKCPNQYVGMLRQFEADAIDVPCRQPTQASCCSGKRAILILESPHTREFVEPMGSAKGSTGRLMRRHLQEILETYEASDFGIILQIMSLLQPAPESCLSGMESHA